MYMSYVSFISVSMGFFDDILIPAFYLPQKSKLYPLHHLDLDGNESDAHEISNYFDHFIH